MYYMILMVAGQFYLQKQGKAMVITYWQLVPDMNKGCENFSEKLKSTLFLITKLKSTLEDKMDYDTCTCHYLFVSKPT